MLIQTVRFIVLIISIPDEELLSETTVEIIWSHDVPVGFATPPPPYFQVV